VRGRGEAATGASISVIMDAAFTHSLRSPGCSLDSSAVAAAADADADADADTVDGADGWLRLRKSMLRRGSMPRDKARQLRRKYRRGSVTNRLIRFFYTNDHGMRARLVSHCYRCLLSIFTVSSEFEVKDRTEPPPELITPPDWRADARYGGSSFNGGVGSGPSFHNKLMSMGPNGRGLSFSPREGTTAGGVEPATGLPPVDPKDPTDSFGLGHPPFASVAQHDSSHVDTYMSMMKAFKLDAIFSTLFKATPKTQRTAQHNHAARLVNLCFACFVLLVLTVYQAELTNILIDTKTPGVQASTMAEVTSQGLVACTWGVVAADLTTLYPGLRTVLINTSTAPVLFMAGGAQLALRGPVREGEGEGCDVIIDDRATLRASQAAGERGAPETWCAYTVTDESAMNVPSAFPIAAKYQRPMDYWMYKISELGMYGGSDNWLLARYETQLGNGARYTLACSSDTGGSSAGFAGLLMNPAAWLTSQSDRGSSGVAGPAVVLVLTAILCSVLQLATRELSDTPELYRTYCVAGCKSCGGGVDGGCAGCRCWLSRVSPVNTSDDDRRLHTTHPSAHMPPGAVVAEKA